MCRGRRSVIIVARSGVAASSVWMCNSAPLRAPTLGVREVGERSGRKVVDNLDHGAVGDEPIDEVRPDEPGTADDEHVGRPTFAGGGVGGSGRVLSREQGVAPP